MIRRLGPFLVFTALVVILLWPVLIGGRALLPGKMLGHIAPWNASQPAGDAHWNALAWDAIAYFYPARKLLGQAIRSGEIPLWNSRQMCGVPFLADPQTAVLYPPNLLFAVLPTDITFGILAALHLLGAGCFTYLFLRGLGLGRMPATLGGIAFMLSGFGIAWLELPGFLNVGAWLPLTLHLSRLAHERRSAFHGVLAGITVALSLVAGHPQIAFYSLLATALFWLYLAVTGRRETRIVHSILLGLVIFVIGLAFAAPQILPTMELADLSHRGGSPTAEGYAKYSEVAMTPANLITLLAPDFYGNPSKMADFWGVGEYADTCGYVGILSLMLAPLAFVGRGKHRRFAWFFGGLAVVALLMVTGTGLNRLFYFGVPGFARSGAPTRALFLYMLSVAILAAFGLDRLLRQEKGRASRILTWALANDAAILVIGLILLKLNLDRIQGSFSGAELLETTLPVLWLFPPFFLAGFGLVVLLLSGRFNRTVCGVAIVGVLAADLLVWGISYNKTCERSEVYPNTHLTTLLRKIYGNRMMPLNAGWSLYDYPEAVMPPNTGMVYGIEDVQGYSALYPMRYKRLLDAAAGRNSSPRENGNMVFAMNPDSPVWDLLGGRGIVSRTPLVGQPVEKADGCYVYQNQGALPRMFIVHTIEFAEDEECLRRITSGEVDLGKVGLVSFEDGRHVNLRSPRRAHDRRTPDAIRGIKGSSRSMTVLVETARPGMLVVTSQHYPGWRATLDRRQARILRADYAFRGVIVPSGRHTVEFTYDPQPFRTGWKIALGTLAVLLCFGVSWLRGQKDEKDKRTSA